MKTAWFSAVISGGFRESKLSISKSLNRFLLHFKYSIEIIWLLFFFFFDRTLYYELLECIVLHFSAWSNWICFCLTFRMAKILHEGTGRSRKVLGSSGCGTALIISILLKTQLSFKAWNVHLVSFHVPIDSCLTLSSIWQAWGTELKLELAGSAVRPFLSLMQGVWHLLEDRNQSEMKYLPKQ